MAVVSVGALVSCASNGSPLHVRQYTLRDTSPSLSDEPLIRGEAMRRLYGAITPKEREDRLGQYYTIEWHDATPGPAAEVVFAYQQGATGSAVHQKIFNFAVGETSGKAEFPVIGENYRKNGRVLAWKATLRRGKQVIAEQRSYLWQ